MLSPTEKKKLKAEIRRMILAGQEKKEIYESLIPVYGERITIANELRKIPTLKRRAENRGLYYLLILLLAATSVTDILAGGHGLIWDIFLFYVVITYRVHYFNWIWFRAGASLLALGIIFFFSFYEEPFSLQMIGFIAGAVFLVFTILVSVWLENRLCPPVVEKKIPYTDSSGKEKIKIVHEFCT